MPLFTQVDNSGILVTEVCAMADAALRLRTLFAQVLGVPLPVRIRAWDGSEAGPPDAPGVNRSQLAPTLEKNSS